MIEYKNIRSVHLEISTRCNAACPDCPRNFRGVNSITDYPLVDMSLATAQKLFTEPFLKQLDHILINGNYGDFITASDGPAIVEYFLSVNPLLKLEISTNASGKPHIWEQLGKLGITVYFRLDGLIDTHHLYRQNTNFDLIIENAKKFISAGGHAIWAMIPFDHNQHQIDQCRQLSKELGFKKFQLVDAGRNTMPVFTADKKLKYLIGNYQGSTNYEELFAQTISNFKYSKNELLQMTDTSHTVACYAKKQREIYISANGEVYPCCFLGFYPALQPNATRNQQLVPLITKNNALDYSIEESVAWFTAIEESWQADSVANGKLYTCDQYCKTKQ